MFFFVWFFVPETKGISLEKMDELFGMTAFVEEKIAADERAPSVGEIGDTREKSAVGTAEARVENV